MQARRFLEAVLAAGTIMTVFAAYPGGAQAARSSPGGTDVSVTATGGAIALDSYGKALTVKVRNNGAVPVTDLQVTYDTSGLTPLVLAAAPLDQIGQPRPCSSGPNGEQVCSYADHVVQPYENFDFGLTAANSRTGSGSGGVIRITISSSRDTNPANNSTTIALSVGGHGGDLLVLADDAFRSDPATGYNTGEALAPGETTSLWFSVFNQGDRPIEGYGYSLRLPDGVIFAAAPDGCVLSPDRRGLSCSFPDRTLVPLIEGDGEHIPGFNLRLLITADECSAGLGRLPSGRSAAYPLPARTLVEPADDTDAFAVHVAAN
jgi:hypothetical protein